MNTSRRWLLMLGGAAATIGKGYGSPLRRELRLKVTNPSVPVVDPKIRGFSTECDAQKLYWKKTYCGTFYIHNSINRSDPAGPETSSGPTPTGYRDYQPGYFGFVSMSYAPVGEATKWGVELQQHDLGPILWPRSGFLTSDGKSKHPKYKNPHPHPSSLIAEDPKDGKKYVYVFAAESAEHEEASNMIIAARSPIESRALPGSFLNYYRGDYTEPSLPKDMTEEIAVLATRPGGNAEAIHPSAEGRMNRFFVARLRRSGLFLSVESYSWTENQNRYFESALRLSEDLRNWTDRFVLPNSRVSVGPTRSQDPPFGLYYPKFLSADGASHYHVDESAPFYIIATKPHALIYRELSIQILWPPATTSAGRNRKGGACIVLNREVRKRRAVWTQRPDGIEEQYCKPLARVCPH